MTRGMCIALKNRCCDWGERRLFVKGERKKKNTSRATAEKAKITKGEGHSFHLSIFLACAGGLYYEPRKHPPFSLPFFPPVSNNIIKNHTINWAMLTEEVVWQREGGFHLQEEGGSRDKKKCSQMITRFARVIPTSQTAPTAGCCCHAKPQPLQGVRVVQVLLCTLHHQARLSGNKLAGWNASSRLHLKETHWTDDVRGWVK